MKIHQTDHERFLTLSLDGRLDISTSSQLKERVLQSLGNGARSIIINLDQVDFINSSGLGTLISILKEVRAHQGRLVLSNMASYVKEIFEITQLADVFEIFASEADAQQALTGAGSTAKV